jgi:RNA polymerase sigma factor (sigma-70 family)
MYGQTRPMSGRGMRNQVRELESSEDSELLASVRQGNDAAFGELYRRHAGAGRAAARSLTRSSADAEDAVAEAFARVLSVMRRGGGPEVALRPYLMTVIRHVCYDRAGASARESLPGESEVMAAIDDHPTYQSADLDQFAESNLVSRAFASLSDRWKQVLWQTDIEGRSPRELAEELELAPTAVAALTFRAREGLADAYLAAHVQHRPTALCNREPSELARYVRNRMRSKEQLTFGAHLAECSRCMEAVEELRVISRPLRSLQWPAFIGTPFVVYGGKVIGVIRRVVTAQFLTTAGAAAVTVATVTVADRVPFDPFDALRPLPYIGLQAALSPGGADTTAATTDGTSSDARGGSHRSAASASVPDALGLPVTEVAGDSAVAADAIATATADSTSPTTALIGPPLPVDTTVATSPAGTGNPDTVAPADTTAPETSADHHPVSDTDTSASDPTDSTDSTVTTDPSVPDVSMPATTVPSGPPISVVSVVGGPETQSGQPADEPTTTTTTSTATTSTTSTPDASTTTTLTDDLTPVPTVPSGTI